MALTLEDVLKGAMLLERRGKAFYEKAARDAERESVRDLFQFLAEEEERHLRALTRAFSQLRESGSIQAHSPGDPGKIAGSILTERIKEEISAASYDSAAIYAAMGFEERAMAYYAREAERAQDEEVRRFLLWLSDWERKHLELLMGIDEELRRKAWEDQSFWPF